jgi:hypothetical protein
MAKEPHKEQFPNLRPPRLYENISSATRTAGHVAAKEEVIQPVAQKLKIEKAKAALADKPASKRGRPVKVADSEPWKAEGVSRMTWYRRQKKEKPE